jgi:adenylate kinase
MDKAINYESMLLDIAFNKGSMAAHDKIRKMI